MKTIKEWLQELPDGAREKALANMDAVVGNEPAHGMIESLASAFDWRKTQQGAKYWRDVMLTLIID